MEPFFYVKNRNLRKVAVHKLRKQPELLSGIKKKSREISGLLEHILSYLIFMTSYVYSRKEEAKRIKSKKKLVHLFLL